MTATSDLIIERRQMRRRLAFWRILAIVALVMVAIIVIPRPGGVGKPGERVARVSIEGVILDDLDRDEALMRLAEDDDVKGVVLRINSPGGTVAGSEALYASMRAVAEKKPVVAVMGEAAASGGYMTALAADHIVARSTTVTGSIGVVAEAPNLAILLDRIGVEFLTTKSSPLKAEPSLVSEPAPGALEAQQALIDDMFVWFRDLVSDRRGLAGDGLGAVTDGRAFTGRQALGLGLIDALGDEDTARAWLESERGVSRDLKIADWTWGKPEIPWPFADLQESLWPSVPIERLLAPGPRFYAVIQ